MIVPVVGAGSVAGSGSASAIRIGAGLLGRLPGLLAEVVPASAVALVVPDDIESLYGEPVLSSMRAAGLRAELLAFRAGEAFKTRDTWAELTDRMLELRFGRDSCVVALGGGVAGDVAGFVAATYMRGVPVVQVPTTLLAMLDASVGGKTGVDTPAGKNLVGAFHPPRLVVMDPLVLRSLPAMELRSGLAEAVKHGAILDDAYFDWIRAHAGALLAVDPSALELLVRRSVELKAGVVAEDPFEHGRRAILNFCHTVGHALELRAHFGIPHGFAVAEGMIAECTIGEHAGVTEPGTVELLSAALRELGLPAATGAFTDLLDSMRLDKKARGAEPRFSLLARIGECARADDGGWTHTVESDVLHAASAAVVDV
ncbi:3-dehydroquinate synthase [soil metagenome]